MNQQILLGPQSPVSNLRKAVDLLGIDGPVVAITAGWRDSEDEIDEISAELGQPVSDLSVYRRAESVFARETGLFELKRKRQQRLKELQSLYRIRLAPTMTAARKLMRATADPELLRLEQRAAIAQLRALDRHHLRLIIAIQREFERRRAETEYPLAVEMREAIHSEIENAGLILVAGGHAAVLLNRIRLFQLAPLMAQKPVIAWSAGAMALSDRVVLFHHNAPQGRREAEVLDAGLGIVKDMVLLPHARSRLDWTDRRRMSLFSRRFAPAACCTLDNGSLIHIANGEVKTANGSDVVTSSGSKKALAAQ